MLVISHFDDQFRSPLSIVSIMICCYSIDHYIYFPHGESYRNKNLHLTKGMMIIIAVGGPVAKQFPWID